MLINELNDRVNLTVTKEDLRIFAEQVIKNYTEQNQDTKFPERMSITQIASYLNYSKAAIYKMVGNSSIPFYQLKPGGKNLFMKTDIDLWLSEGKQSTVSEFCLKQDRRR